MAMVTVAPVPAGQVPDDPVRRVHGQPGASTPTGFPAPGHPRGGGLLPVVAAPVPVTTVEVVPIVVTEEAPPAPSTTTLPPQATEDAAPSRRAPREARRIEKDLRWGGYHRRSPKQVRDRRC
jgi:hypothetical protein